ncbi:class I SAM-dependent DNA methyltransferase [Terasakiella pusilla]|uniref:class I SAM-dependent DNA methyltransferase n=1 Tax=Terasakiella pusilla TaxID=64973 RepID=UPI003AA8842A
MSKIARFWDRHAVGYSKRKVTNEDAYQKKLEQARAYLTPDAEVFEFGCGTGTTALNLADDAGHILAIDASQKMIEIAQGKARDQHKANVTFAQDEIESFVGLGKQFDVVMAHSILHLLKDRQTVLKQVHELLKPDGVFISSTMCMKGVWPWLRIIVPLGHFFGLLPLVRFFRPDELLAEIQQAGFEVEVSWQPTLKEGLFVIARKKAP